MSNDIDNIENSEGVFEPYQDYLHDPKNADIVASAKAGTKQISSEFEKGNPTVVKEVEKFRRNTYGSAFSNSPAGKALSESIFKEKSLTDSDKWNIFVSGVTRGLNERASQGDKEAKQWATFDQEDRPKFPFEEVTTLIDPSYSKPASKRFEPER